MGADNLYLYYGVRRAIPLEDEQQIQLLEEDRHPICSLAYDHKLHFTWGRLTDGADYFLLIGHEFGNYGVEGIHEQVITDERFKEIVEKTKQRLKAAGIVEPPAICVQLQAQY
ncbi:MAG TPA: hypothetical protein VE988_12885 [Gemmataceae bacterium]|nr:hypothetical protein [Gemmataceae bacterium]